jgi:hypothetical protein
MAVVEDQRDWQISELQRLLKDERATTDYLNDMIEGLNYGNCLPSPSSGCQYFI